MKGLTPQDHSPALEGALSKLGGFGNPGPGVGARPRGPRPGCRHRFNIIDFEMNILSTDQIIDAFARLKADEPEKFYNACGYGDQGVNVTHPFVSGSYELGLIAGAKYALDHLVQMKKEQKAARP